VAGMDLMIRHFVAQGDSARRTGELGSLIGGSGSKTVVGMLIIGDSRLTHPAVTARAEVPDLRRIAGGGRYGQRRRWRW